jgi:DNA-binding CsgD family transcriptional regulator
VLGQLAQGKSNRDLARALGISENTVKNHVRSVLEKLNAQSRSEAVVIALKAGIVALHH